MPILGAVGVGLEQVHVVGWAGIRCRGLQRRPPHRQVAAVDAGHAVLHLGSEEEADFSRFLHVAARLRAVGHGVELAGPERGRSARGWIDRHRRQRPLEPALICASGAGGQVVRLDPGVERRGELTANLTVTSCSNIVSWMNSIPALPPFSYIVNWVSS